MAIDAGTIYEFRATGGASTNGGGWADLDPGTSVDYSNQDAAQLTLTDGATSGAAVTTFTSATGGFTAAMVGSVLQIASGTNDNPGWYQITAYTDTNTVTLDQAPDDGVGGVSGANFKVGGALDILTDNFIDNANAPGVVAGVKMWIRNDGTMTLTGSITTPLDGTSLLPITIEGYNSSRGDNPTGANRPVIAAAANAKSFDDFWIFKNLIITTTDTLGLDADTGAKAINVKVSNTSGSAAREAFTFSSSGSMVIGCEATATLGTGILMGVSGRVLFTYAHDCNISGISAGTNDGGNIIGCVVDTCATGITIPAFIDRWTIVNNTVYNCTTGILVSANSVSVVIVNNILDANTTGVSWGNADKSHYMDYNVWDNGTDVINVSKGLNAITSDPLMLDPANGNFRLLKGSPARNVGIDVSDAGAT